MQNHNGGMIQILALALLAFGLWAYMTFGREAREVVERESIGVAMVCYTDGTCIEE